MLILVGFLFPQNLPLYQTLHLILRASLSLNYQIEAEVICTISGQSCLVLLLSENSPMVVVGLIEPPNHRTVVTFDATSDVYVAVYTWNSASGETIFDGQVSFISPLELPISKLRVSFSFRFVCGLFLLLQLLPLHNHLLTVQNLHLHLPY